MSIVYGPPTIRSLAVNTPLSFDETTREVPDRVSVTVTIAPITGSPSGVSHNTDLGDGWEREGEDSWYFTEFSEKKAYPLGINIVTYALTH